MRHLEGGYRILEPAERLAHLEMLQRQRAQLDAQEQYLLHVLASEPTDDDPELDKQWIREDVACLLRLPGGTAQAKLDIASELVTRLPGTLDAVARGEITLLHARRLAEAVGPLSDESALAVQAAVLPVAAGLTVAQFADRVRRAVLHVDARAAEERHRDRRAERRVAFTPVEDGMTELWALLPADGAARLRQRLDECCDLTAGQDDRTADQRRADALCDLGAGRAVDGSRGASVQVTVALSTLLGLDDQPAELDNHGPISAGLARALAFDPGSRWRRLLTDSCGELLDVGRATYRPPIRIARHVRTSQRTCVFPGCRRAARRCHLDHITAWHDRGTTSAQNLQPLCTRHHHLKHDTSWRVHREPDGVTRWTTPTGRIHDRPPDRLPIDTTMRADPAPF